MTKVATAAGYFRGGLPYNRFGDGPRTLVIFQGLFFENKPLPSQLASFFTGFRFLEKHYTIYLVNRKPGLPIGYSIQDMADDYAAMIKYNFGAPVDIIGFSTGGSIAQYFAASYPSLVRRLVLHSTAYKLSEAGKDIQRQISNFAQKHQWRDVFVVVFSFLLPHTECKGFVSKAVINCVASIVAKLPFIVPQDPSDLAITIESEDRFSSKTRLSEIAAPTLVIAGDRDPFYSESLFSETADGIPKAKLIIYKEMGHPASGKKFRQDVLRFLSE